MAGTSISCPIRFCASFPRAGARVHLRRFTGLLCLSCSLPPICSFPSANATSQGTARKRLGPGLSVCYINFVSELTQDDPFIAVWGPYPNYDDIARLEYGRMLWRLPEMRARFLRHWTDERHPY